jgi:hypothetical protein
MPGNPHIQMLGRVTTMPVPSTSRQSVDADTTGPGVCFVCRIRRDLRTGVAEIGAPACGTHRVNRVQARHQRSTTQAGRQYHTGRQAGRPMAQAEGTHFLVDNGPAGRHPITPSQRHRGRRRHDPNETRNSATAGSGAASTVAGREARLWGCRPWVTRGATPSTHCTHVYALGPPPTRLEPRAPP